MTRSGRLSILVIWTLVFMLAVASRGRGQMLVQPSPAEVAVINANNVFAQAMVMPGNSIPRIFWQRPRRSRSYRPWSAVRL